MPGHRVHRVVDEVAQDGDQVPRVDHPLGQQRGGGQAQGYAAFGGDGGLADQQRRQQRVPYPLGDLLGGGPVGVGDARDELCGPVVAADLDQPEDGVQAVGVFVALSAQRVQQPLRAVQFAAEEFQFGAVAQRHHRPAVPGRHAVGDQYPAAADGQQVGSVDASGQYVRRSAPGQGLVRGVAGGVRVERQQSPGLVVDQADPTAPVAGDDTLPDTVQHGLALVEEGGDVGEGDAVGAAAHTAGDQERGQDTDGERGARVQHHSGNRTEQLIAHAAVGDADRDRPHDVAPVVAQRHFGAGGAAERSGVDLHDLVAGEHATGIRGDVVADLGRVGVRPAHAVGVHHDDVQRPGGPAYAFGLVLHRPRRTRLGGDQIARDVRLGGGLGDGERPAHRLVVELGAERGEEQAGGENRHPGSDGQLHGQHLGEDTPGPRNPHLPTSSSLVTRRHPPSRELIHPIDVVVNAR